MGPARTIVLADRLDLAAAAPLRQALLAHRGEPAELDGSRVQTAGVSCVQVILAAAAAWRADDVPFGVAGASPALTESLRRLGAEQALQGKERA